jgi:ABC-2 type transport system permease protein
VTVRLAPEDPRYADLQRSVLAKLGRVLPDLTIRLVGARSFAASTGDDRYGEVEYVYGTRRDVSRSTSPREILPLLYGLAGVPVPTPSAADEYPGYPLVGDGYAALPWFFGGLPLATVLAWWSVRRPPRIDPALIKEKEDAHEDH